MNVVVIGAGFGGLAAAIRLRAQGHDVTVVEKRDQPGGRAYVFHRDGFVFDAGPTIITAPHLIDDLFSLHRRRREDYVSLVPLDPFYRVRFDDGTQLECSARESHMEAQVARINPSDVAGYRRFVREARRIFDAAMPLIDVPVDSVDAMLRLAPALVRTRAWRSVATVASRCVSDPRLRQALSFHPLLIGGNPFDSPAIYALIPELEKRWGVWYAVGGTGALVKALVRLLEEVGGRLRYDCEVREIGLDSRRRTATSVTLHGGERLDADAVISNADPAWTCSHLGAVAHRHAKRERRTSRLRYGMSVFVIYFGTDRRYAELGHHEILMGPRYRELLADVFRRKRLADDFSLYLHHPTASDQSLAPSGCDTWYALVPVPNLEGDVDWSVMGERLRDRVVAYLEQRYMPDLGRHIVAEHRIDPRYFRDELNAPFGSAFSLQPLLRQSAWFRPHNVFRDIPNLFLVGAGTHPGAGIPGVLSSGKIAADLIEARLGVSKSLDPSRPSALAAEYV